MYRHRALVSPVAFKRKEMYGQDQFEDYTDSTIAPMRLFVIVIAIVVTWLFTSEYRRIENNGKMRVAADHYFSEGVKHGYELGTKDFFQNFSDYADSLEVKASTR